MRLRRSCVTATGSTLTYQADGVTPGGPDATACRGCHLSQEDKDWFFRYDEYFAQRGRLTRCVVHVTGQIPLMLRGLPAGDIAENTLDVRAAP